MKKLSYALAISIILLFIAAIVVISMPIKVMNQLGPAFSRPLISACITFIIAAGFLVLFTGAFAAWLYLLYKRGEFWNPDPKEFKK